MSETALERRDIAVTPTTGADDATPQEVVHVVTPASKMHELLLGNKTKVRALCGEWVKTAAAASVPVCRACFDELVSRDRNEVPEAAST